MRILMLSAGLIAATAMAQAQNQKPVQPQVELNARYSKNIGAPTDGRLRTSRYSGVEEAFLPVIAPSSHAANLIVLKNGDLLCFWFTGTWEGQSGVGIAMSRLARGSRQWTKPMLIDSKAGVSYQNPVPFQAPDGTIWLFHTEQSAGKGESNAHVLLVKSSDNGKTWSKPKVLLNDPGSFTRDPIVLMQRGGWLLPMYMSSGKTAQQNYSIVKISHDRGENWKTCDIPESNALVQPSVVRLPDGSYVAFLRSRRADWIYRSTSRDGCRWSSPVTTSLPNNNASIQAVLLSNGHIALAFNDSPRVYVNGKPRPGARKPLALAISADGGKTWPWKRNIESRRPSATPLMEKEKTPGREEYSYPTVVQDPDGDIDVAFTYRRQTIKFMRFPESWVVQSSGISRKTYRAVPVGSADGGLPRGAASVPALM